MPRRLPSPTLITTASLIALLLFAVHVASETLVFVDQNGVRHSVHVPHGEIDQGRLAEIRAERTAAGRSRGAKQLLGAR